MRCYSFHNFYFAGIHAGIQAAHSHDEMTIKYALSDKPQPKEVTDLYRDWIMNHKTMVILKAGDHGDICDINEFLSNAENPFPWAPFFESKRAANEMATDTSIVLPEYMYMYNREILKFMESRSDDYCYFNVNGAEIKISWNTLASGGERNLAVEVTSTGEEYVYDEFKENLIRLIAPMPSMN